MAYEIAYINHDLVIIGAGGSGLSASIFASYAGLDVAVISKVHPMQSHTVAAQGGINASLGNVSVDDWRWHAFDTMKAGAGLADVDSVKEMCSTAPSVIEWLSKLGVEFDKNVDGKINQRVYGGQSQNYGAGDLAHRACFVKDYTGSAIMHSLYQEAMKIGVCFYDYHFAIKLISVSGACAGVICIDFASGRVVVIRSKDIIIATGGYSQIYGTTTSASSCTGDGNALVYGIGVGLQDMEFVQFHPTGLSGTGVLISEAARASGAILRNNMGERFMKKYEPRLLELATRDVVARAIAKEISQDRGVGDDKNAVFLDLRHMSRQDILEKLPTVFENCQSFAKIDPSEQMIPVAPAAHYTMGGIPTDSNCRVVQFKENGEHSLITGLYAIGEAACTSVHGAGRLGCNSLLDLVVFAKKTISVILSEAAKVESSLSNNRLLSKPIYKDEVLEKSKVSTAEDIGIFEESKLDLTTKLPLEIEFQKKSNDSFEEQVRISLNELNKLTSSASSFIVPRLLQELKKLMSTKVGVFRTQEQLQEAIKQINDIDISYRNSGAGERDLIWNKELQQYLELGNLILSAKATAKSALWREESRGAHWRDDFQNQDPNFLGHSICTDGFVFLRPVRS